MRKFILTWNQVITFGNNLIPFKSILNMNWSNAKQQHVVINARADLWNKGYAIFSIALLYKPRKPFLKSETTRLVFDMPPPEDP